MNRTTINPWTWQDQLGYAQGVLTEGAGQTLYLAGQCAVDATGTPVAPGDMEGQVSCALDNVEAVLDGAGLGLADVVRLDVLTTDIAAYFAAMPKLVGRFAEHGPYPAGGFCVQVTQLAMPGLLVELVATAAR